MCNIFNLTTSVYVQDLAKEILEHTLESTPLLNNDSPTMLLPGNIRWESGDTGISTVITSLDELFVTEYYDTEAVCPYYDIRNGIQIPNYYQIIDDNHSTWSLFNNMIYCS